MIVILFNDYFIKLTLHIIPFNTTTQHYIISLLLQWQLPSFSSKDSTSSPSGCLGVSYMDGKIWLDVRDLTGKIQP